MKRIDQKQLAKIEYHGNPDTTRSCINAMVRLIHFGDRIEKAKLLSCSGFHCFLLVINNGDNVAIKRGFSSGYPGQGPNGLSIALQLLQRHEAEIDEYCVKEEILRRVDDSCLLQSDLESLCRAKPVRPHRFHDYIYDIDQVVLFENKRLRDQFPITLPFGYIDLRLIDLALKFESNPDAAILSGFRRLEDLVRERAGLRNESGVKLFSKAFQSDKSILCWPHLETGEQTGRGSIFTGVFMAFRNRRAHGEPKVPYVEAVREFLLLNELFLMEAEASVRD